MTRLLFTLILICPQLIFSQSSAWLELDMDCSETPYFVEYISDSNHTIISIPGTNQSFITTDEGQSFQSFPWAYGRFIVEIQTEANSEDFYFTNGSIIYRYDKNTASAELIHDNNQYGYILQGVILTNGEKLIIYNDGNEVFIGRFDTLTLKILQGNVSI